MVGVPSPLTPLGEEMFRKWLVDRPDSVKSVAWKHPPGTRIEFGGAFFWVIGYQEFDDEQTVGLITIIGEPDTPPRDWDDETPKVVFFPRLLKFTGVGKAEPK